MEMVNIAKIVRQRDNLASKMQNKDEKGMTWPFSVTLALTGT